MSEQTLSPEIIEAARKLQAKIEKDTEKRKEHIAATYPYADVSTLDYDSVAKKFIVVVTCVRCGEEHSRYTSDLKQTKGICPDCKKASDKETKAAKKELLTKAMQAIRDGQI